MLGQSITQEHQPVRGMHQHPEIHNLFLLMQSNCVLKCNPPRSPPAESTGEATLHHPGKSNPQGESKAKQGDGKQEATASTYTLRAIFLAQTEGLSHWLRGYALLTFPTLLRHHPGLLQVCTGPPRHGHLGRPAAALLIASSSQVSTRVCPNKAPTRWWSAAMPGMGLESEC